MTRTTNARIAGFTYLFYAVIGICIELLMHRARNVDGDAAAKLARIGELWLFFLTVAIGRT